MYHYDVEDPDTYGSFNNRLMFYETFETCRVFEDYGHDGGCGTEDLVSTTWYYYGQSGNPWYIVTELAVDPEGEEPQYFGTRLHYASNGRAVTFALGMSWDEGYQDYNVDWAREFRYDSARQRYMNAVLDPGDLESGIVNPTSTTWSDYDGDSVYGDFTYDQVTGFTELRSFQPGMGKFDWSGPSPDTSTVQFYHTNQIGTTRFMTDSGGEDDLPAIYTAFGERTDGTNHRYGYGGAWGYQTHDDLPFLHVGHRYYDPATGRFLQRDPIAIRGGTNVYAYVRSNPTLWIDFDGTQRRNPKTGRFMKKPWWKRAGKGKAGLVGLCLWLIEREVVPRLDEWIEDNYNDGMDDINNPPPGDGTPPDPNLGDYPEPPPGRLA